MEEDVAQTVIKTLRAYLHDELPPDKDFFRQLDKRGLLASNTASELAQLADQGKRDCVWNLVTYMEQFYTEEMLLRLCNFLEEYAQPARPRLAVIASRIRQEISKHKPPPVREDTLHRSAGVHDDVTVVESISDFLPYLTDMTAHLSVLAAALEVFESSEAIIGGHGTPEEKCLHILSHWLKSTPRPTWACLCQQLGNGSFFNPVVHRIARDHNLPTADMDGRELSGISSGEDKMDEPLPSRLKRTRSPPRDENPSTERVKSNIDDVTAPGPSGSTRSPSTGDQTPPPKRDKSSILDRAVLLPYKDHFVEHLLSLSVVLGVGRKEAAAILATPASHSDKYIQITNKWMQRTPNPTWEKFCSCLKGSKDFTRVRAVIEQEQLGRHEDLLLPKDPSHSLPLPPSPASPSPPTWTEQYEKAIEQRGSVTVHITRCVLIGPPRVGKSSLKLLLINNEPPDKEVEKSTDLMEAPVVLTSIQYQDKKGSQWKELTTNSLQQLVSKCTREEEYDPAQPNPIQSSQASQFTSGVSISHISYNGILSTTVTESSSTSMHLADSEMEVMYHDFLGATMSEESLAELKMNGLKMVHVFDCGGQLAFQDTIPLLINAPCAFISVFNASIDLDEEVELKYCPKKGEELGLGHKESQWNMLRRIFSSIHSLQFKCHGDILHLIKDKTVPSSPIAVVGTHKDVLREASKKDGGLRQRRTEEKIKEYLARLRDSKLYDFLREGCTHDLVTNQFKDDLSAIESLRNDITESKATLSLELPLPWIILELFTRDLKQNFFPFLDLQQLCIRKNIVSHKEEFSSLLKVLHVLGFYAFYQLDGVPEDQNWVCTDAATLYREVTKMLVVQYKKNIKKGATIELQQYGRIKLNKATLQDLFTDLEISIGGADPMWLIRVLLHIGLAAKIEVEGKEEAFIPLALPFKHSDLPPVTSVATVCFSLEFPSGASKRRVHANIAEISRGVFPRLIVYLLSAQQHPGEYEWKADKGDSRSRIKLIRHSHKYIIYLSEHVDHIELDLVLNDTFLLPTAQHYSEHNTPVRNLCQWLRKHLESALGDTFVSVFGEQPLERTPSVVCGLKCSSCHDSSHMAIVRPADESTPQHPLYTEKCVHVPNRQFVEKPGQLIWFSPNKETTPQFERKTFRTKNGQSKIWVMKGTLESDLANRPSAKDLRDISHKTGKNSKDLLRSLEIEEARIATFVMDNPNDSAEACYQGLMLWENENVLLPVTWGTLKAALKKADLTKLANELPPKEK